MAMWRVVRTYVRNSRRIQPAGVMDRPTMGDRWIDHNQTRCDHGQQYVLTPLIGRSMSIGAARTRTVVDATNVYVSTCTCSFLAMLKAATQHSAHARTTTTYYWLVLPAPPCPVPHVTACTAGLAAYACMGTVTQPCVCGST